MASSRKIVLAEYVFRSQTLHWAKRPVSIYWPVWTWCLLIFRIRIFHGLLNESFLKTNRYYTLPHYTSKPNKDEISGALFTFRIQYEYTPAQYQEGARYVIYLKTLRCIFRIIHSWAVEKGIRSCYSNRLNKRSPLQAPMKASNITDIFCIFFIDQFLFSPIFNNFIPFTHLKFFAACRIIIYLHMSS